MRIEEFEWRVFRLYLLTLEDPELIQTRIQLGMEASSRRAIENNAARLLFSSLDPEDLELARTIIAKEIEERKSDRQWLESNGVPAGGSNAAP